MRSEQSETATAKSFDADRSSHATLRNRVTARWRLALSLVLAAALFLGVGGWMWRQWDAQGSEHVMQRAQASAAVGNAVFQWLLEQEARVLEEALRPLLINPDLRAAFVARERDRLHALAQPLFVKLRARRRVTHFYFHLPSGVNFLRVHHPKRFGDQIQRVTLEQARASGEIASGIELGPLGTLALRVVSPVRQDGQIIGYLELGEEINHVAPMVKRISGGDLLVGVFKSLLSRKTWIEGQAALGNADSDWDEYPNMIISDRTAHLWAPDLDLHIMTQGHGGVSFVSRVGSRKMVVTHFVLRDAGKREIGALFFLQELAALSAAGDAQQQRVMFGLLILAAGVLAILLISHMGLSLVYAADVRRSQRLLQESLDAQSDLQRQRFTLQEALQTHQRALAEEQALNTLKRLALTAPTQQAFLEGALDSLLNGMPWLGSLEEGCVFLTETDSAGAQRLRLTAAHRLSPKLRTQCAVLEFGQCLCGRAAQSRQPVFAEHVDERHEILFDGMAAHGHFILPLIQDNQMLGVLNLYLPDGAERSAGDEAFLTRAAEAMALGLTTRSLRGRSWKAHVKKGE
ncbi:cache domain-containing protein [Magnetofaba australis]|uniref:GAF domain-containing protein n=1 Tax=Magnetofaba australis IT-1 TaxID=1434232 RepID=A0A1Y2K914_9PROT|nr:cache domain-containing protein [Magnetofaba australis]OSM07228.1 hypothetical protein MAIT1_03841 [Magnetofaba australis IT-1]